MILANSTWGEWLAEHGVPGIYRSQASLAPGVKVRMGTRALPHAGLGVKSYAWSTSPLRRYTDQGKLPCRRTAGGQRRFKLSEVLVLLEQRGEEAR